MIAYALAQHAPSKMFYVIRVDRRDATIGYAPVPAHAVVTDSVGDWRLPAGHERYTYRDDGFAAAWLTDRAWTILTGPPDDDADEDDRPGPPAHSEWDPSARPSTMED